MAMAKKCDRCEKCYDLYFKDYEGEDLNGAGLFNDREGCIVYDLCQECLTQLIEWFEGGEAE